MAHSQTLSVDEDVVFYPVDESSPEFLHSEKERHAVEKLLSGGPEAFYRYIGPEHSSCFMSPEEVSQISKWVQQYCFNPAPMEEENNMVCSQSEDFCSTYFPQHSDIPAPNLDLGWPVKNYRSLNPSISVHSNPPIDGTPHIREIIRHHLQEAKQVIAIVTERLTDNTIIADLHRAASRNVPVYIILNQRTIQENFTLNRLKHPNMKVRALGGKTFCSRSGRMIIGELKENFILVDLETVIHGNYSLTWADTHLHRQLITVLKGPDVAMFDREYRILFAASVPAHHTLRNKVDSKTNICDQTEEFLYLEHQKQVSVEYDNLSPLSPPTIHIMDWEAMGVVQRDGHLPSSSVDQHKEPLIQEVVQNNIHAERPLMDRRAYNGHHLGDNRSEHEATSGLAGRGHIPSTYHNPNPMDQEKMKRLERTINKAIHKQLVLEDNTHSNCKSPVGFRDEAPHRTQTTDRTSRRGSFPQETAKQQNRFDLNIDPPSRSSAVFERSRVEKFTSPSDILNRLRRGVSFNRNDFRSTLSERTQSMMDLSSPRMDQYDARGPVPRFKSNLEPTSYTPSYNFLRKRNEEGKSTTPRERPQSNLYVPNRDRRWSIAERSGYE